MRTVNRFTRVVGQHSDFKVTYTNDPYLEEPGDEELCFSPYEIRHFLEYIKVIKNQNDGSE
jgi:hypothetical protein